ncbi:MAG TPA: cytochrome c [Solirubrobacteraceae bacterium]|jgi:mono/diheme cytochrome c family protein|nr:cytochrome c [Solirubrobacteraceae bacterium]
MTPRRALLTLAAMALAAIAPVACGGGETEPAGDAAAGKRLFAEQGCGGCHTFAPAGSRGTTGPDLDAARPSPDKVVRQLRKPGGLMPSFAGKLSDREMRDLAAFVGTASGSDEAVTKPFAPDDTRLSDCRTGDAECLEQAFGNITFREGPKIALERLEASLRTDRRVQADCHRIAHRMGSAALSRFRGRVAPAFIAGSPVCASGYYHGIVERAFLGQPTSRLTAVARRMCSDPQIEQRRFLAYQCIHGLGHGLMIYTGYDLPRSLRTCDGLSTGFDRVSCTGGVFMENFNSSYGVTSKYLRRSDPIYPCNAVVERHKLYCYLLVTANILRVEGGDLRRTADACLRSERRWVSTCYESFGRDVSGLAGNDARRALAGCRLARRYEGDCLYGVAREIVNADADGARGGRFCQRAPRRHRDRCLEGVGSVLAAVAPNPARLRRACRDAGGRLATACLRGAGLAS